MIVKKCNVNYLKKSILLRKNTLHEYGELKSYLGEFKMTDLRAELYGPLLIDQSYVTSPKKVKVDNNNDEELAEEISGKKKVKKDKTADGKDDGSIGFWGALKNVGKGIGNFFKGMVCDKEGNFSIGQTLKTIAIGAVIGAASVLIPGAGTVIALTALGLAAKNVVSAGIDIATAETDADAEAAWQNMGSGLTEGALAYAGVKATGGFGKLRSAGKAIKNSASDFKAAYKAGGRRAVATEARAQGSRAWEGIQDTYRTTRQGTIDNWKNLTDSQAKYNSKIKSYDEQIGKAKTPEAKARLQNEKASYQKGHDSVAHEADYTTARKTVQDAKAQMNAAEKAYKANKTDANRQALENARAEYNAANKTLETRVNNGEFKVTDEAALKNIKDNAKAEYEKMTQARNDLRQAEADFKANKITEAELNAKKDVYNNQYEAYSKAVNEEIAAIGRTSKTFIVKETVGEGFKRPETKWLTLAYGGRDTVQNEYEYVA